MNRGSSELYDLAEEAFKSVPESEKEAWLKSPITRSLRYTLMGDIIGFHESWQNGNFTGPSSDETAQLNARALGSVNAVEDILAWLDDALAGDLYND